MKLNKIWIIGAGGSGKSTLGKVLSKKYKIKVYELDDIYWEKKWNKKRGEIPRHKILVKIINNESWIIEGAYSSWIEYGL